jgi:hypothetical protein
MIGCMPTPITTLDAAIHQLQTIVRELGINETARRTKMPLGSVHRFQDGHTTPSATTLQRMAHGLGYEFRFRKRDQAQHQRTAVRTAVTPRRRRPSSRTTAEAAHAR